MTPDYPTAVISAPLASLTKLLDAAAPRPFRLLVIDDDPDTVRMLCALLRRPNRVMATAGTLAAALVEVAKAPPDLVLLDLQLPDGRGESVIDALPDVPVLAMSGTADEDRIARLRARPGVTFKAKPVDFASVAGWVRELEGTVAK